MPTCQEKLWKSVMRGRRLPARYPRPSDRTETHPGQPRPLTAAPHSTARSPPGTRGPPISATQIPLTYDSLPLTALTLGGCADAAVQHLTCFPRPLTNPRPRVTPQLRGGVEREAGAGRTQGRGCSFS